MGMKRAVALGTIVLLMASFGAAAQTAKGKIAKSSIVDQAKAYCTATGGVVELRHAVWGTNNPQQDWLWLTAEESYCQYTLADDGSRIHLSLQTLYSSKPTLAALATTRRSHGMARETGTPPLTTAHNSVAQKSE